MDYFMKKTYVIMLFLFILAANISQSGEILKLNDIKDQFDKNIKIDKLTKQIIFSFSKESGQRINKFLRNNPGYLNKNNIVYIADMSKVPSFVLSWFMLPKFKEYQYSVGLAKDADKLSTIARRPNKITVISLDKLNILKTNFVDSLE
jgi:hypothetical protein